MKARQNLCIDLSVESFSPALNSLYVRKFVDENTKKDVEEMVNGIQEEMFEILSSVDWLDDVTR